MECPLENEKGTELAVGYAAGTLDAPAAAAFEQHLETCAKCRAMAATQQAVWSTLEDWRPLPVSADFDRRLFQRIAEEDQSHWWRRLPRANWTAWFTTSWRPSLPVATACAILIAAFLLKQPVFTPAPPSSGQPKVQIEQLERALDDMDILNQLGVEAAPDQPGSTGRI